MKLKCLYRSLLAAFFIISTSLNSYAVNKVASTATPATLSQMVQLLKRFKNAEEALQSIDALAPSANAHKWLSFYKANNVDLKKYTFENMRVDGNKLYLNNVTEPFVFSNDRKTISYEGVDFSFSMNQSPENNLRRMQKAWGSLQEYQPTQQTSKLQFFISYAFAKDQNIPGGVISAGIGLGLVTIIAGLTGMTVAAAAGTVVGSLAILGAFAYIVFETARNADLRDFLRTAELQCEPTPQFWMAAEGAKEKQIVTNDILNILKIKEPAKIGEFLDAMKKDCESDKKTKTFKSFLEKQKSISTTNMQKSSSQKSQGVK